MANKQTYWQTHLDAWRQSGLSQAGYCKQHGLSLSSFGYWLHRRTESTPPPAALPILVAKPSLETQVEVRLPNGWSVRLAASAERLHILPLLRELAAC
jgi:hypothetical protein